MAMVAAVSGSVTVIFALLPDLQLAHWPTVRVVLETSGSLIALVATFLIYGRLLRSKYLNELLLASAFGILAVANLLFVAIPKVAGWAPDDLTVWVTPFARGLAAVLFTVAAFIPRLRLRRSGRVQVLAGVTVIIALGLATLLVHLLSDHWPNLAATITRTSITHPVVHAHPALSVFELPIALLYGVAAIGFLRRSRRFGDEFFGWLAVAAVLAATSHVNYSLFPWLYSQSVLYTGDIFRFAFYVALLVGCLREIRSYWGALSEAAVLEERRRIARDLHDGLAQELAYISRNLELLTTGPNRENMGRVLLAVERAQLESRRAIHALAPSENQAVEVALAEAAMEVAERYRIQLDLDLAPGIRLSPTRAEALVRIACEAVANAARHSGARTATIHLERDGSLVRLQISDRGRGFDPTVPRTGFGLTAMRERARSVGGDLHICSAPGRGSEVEVSV